MCSQSRNKKIDSSGDIFNELCFWLKEHNNLGVNLFLVCGKIPIKTRYHFTSLKNLRGLLKKNIELKIY